VQGLAPAAATGNAAWRATLAGLAATLVGVGLARFAYTPLVPALIEGGWFIASEAAYLGAANFLGYLAGALAIRWLPPGLSQVAVLRGAMLLAAATFLACAFPLSFAWYAGWRFLAGFSGGLLMVLAAAAVLPQVPAERRGLAGGVIYTGVGVGIALSGTLVPPLVAWGLREAWLAFGLVALVLMALAWSHWPPRGAARAEALAPGGGKGPLAGFAGLYVGYALNALGLVPHMLFLVDFVARGLDRGLAAGAGYWVLFGIGASVGPVLTGRVGDRLGFSRAIRLGFFVQAAAVLVPTLSQDWPALAVSSLVVGAFTPGIVPLFLGRTQELARASGASPAVAWGYATAAFAFGQAVGAYAASLLFSIWQDYALLFQLAAAGLVLALAIESRPARPR